MHPSPPPANSSDRLPALDGLRGIAVLLVVAWHYAGPANVWFPVWSGVDLFFVLSGYLITGRLLATKEKPGYFSLFYRNRILRIFPLYYVFLIGFLLAVHFFVHNHRAAYGIYLVHWKSFLFFLQNWTFIRYPLPADQSLLPLWSLAVEEQFYLLWPLLILVTPNAIRPKIFMFLIVLVLLSRICWYLFMPQSVGSIYYNTFFRSDAFLAGSLLRQWHVTGKKIPAIGVNASLPILAAMLVAGCLWSGGTSYEGPFFATAGYTLLALFYTGILHLGTQPENALSRFLRRPILLFFGRISFCLYLIHFPILVFIVTRAHTYGIQHWPGHQALVKTMATGMAIAIAIAISAWSNRYFESIFLRLKKHPVT